jgi:hypothetical protein
MVFCGEKGCFGGDEEVELKEPCRKGLLERLEGLVLLGLGPPAILSFVLPYVGGRLKDKETRSWRVEAWEARKGRWQQ